MPSSPYCPATLGIAKLEELGRGHTAANTCPSCSLALILWHVIKDSKYVFTCSPWASAQHYHLYQGRKRVGGWRREGHVLLAAAGKWPREKFQGAVAQLQSTATALLDAFLGIYVRK